MSIRSTLVCIGCIEAIQGWMSSNRLKLNASKTEVMWLGSSRRIASVSFPAVTLSDCVVPVSAVSASSSTLYTVVLSPHVYLVVNSILVVNLLRLSEGEIKPLLTNLLTSGSLPVPVIISGANFDRSRNLSLPTHAIPWFEPWSSPDWTIVIVYSAAFRYIFSISWMVFWERPPVWSCSDRVLTTSGTQTAPLAECTCQNSI